MTIENRERLIEAKGILDGLSYCAEPRVADAIDRVIESIDLVLEDEQKKKG